MQTLRRLSHLATIGLIVTFALFLVLIASLAVYGTARAGEAYSGVSIAGIDVSGKSRAEISSVVDQTFYEYQQQPVTLVAGDQEFTANLADLGVSINKEATIERAMRYGRDGSWWDRSIQWARAMVDPHDIEPVVDVNSAVFNQHLQTIAPNIVAAPQDAYVDFSGTGEPTLVADVPGTSISVDTTRSLLTERVRQLESEPVSLSLISVPAAVNAAAIESGLPNAQRAVSSALNLQSDEGEWPVEPEQLKQLVWIDDQGALNVHEDRAREVIEGVATDINRPSQDANITVDGQGNFIVVPAIYSAEVDVEASTEALVNALKNGETGVPLVVQRDAPRILDEVAAAWAEKADKLAGQGVTVSWGDESAVVTRGELIWAMVIEPQPDNPDEPFKLTFDQAVLAEQMQPIADAVYIEPEDVVMRYLDGEIKTVSEAVEGRQVNLEASAEKVNDAAMEGSFKAPLKIDKIEPTYTSEDKSDISLDDLLGDSMTYYGDSSEPRSHNVERASELENGWLVPPGGIFSYAQVMGQVTPENGFVTGYGIVANPSGGVTTAPVVGGGICQVSTTIFQAAWWAGMEIVERYEHPYWLLAYGNPPRGMMGLDAMVNIEPDWALDLKFRNTTDDWIAVTLYADGANVGAEIYGTDQGWNVQTDDPTFSNIVKADPTMVYTDSTELPAGEELQVEYAKDGFDAKVKRTIRDENGNVIDEYTLESSYAASRNMTLRGVGSGTGEEISTPPAGD
jgi:vancomycin resistance protein YoaR